MCPSTMQENDLTLGLLSSFVSRAVKKYFEKKRGQAAIFPSCASFIIFRIRAYVGWLILCHGIWPIAVKT